MTSFDALINTDQAGVTETQQAYVEMYCVDSCVYMGIEVPMMGTQWIKVPASAEVLDAYDMDVVNSQLGALDSVAELELLRYETLDGERCMVLSLTPDIDALFDFLGEQLPVDTGYFSPEQVAGMFDEFEYNVWIGTETSYLRKMTADFRMTIDEETLTGSAGTGMGSMVMETEIVMTVFDYNVPVSIVLPEEAKSAVDMTSGEFLG